MIVVSENLTFIINMLYLSGKIRAEILGEEFFNMPGASWGSVIAKKRDVFQQVFSSLSDLFQCEKLCE